MRMMMLLFVHILVTLARLLGHCGVKAVMADSLLLRHQLIVTSRTRRKAPNLSATDRFFMGICSLFLHPTRIAKAAVILKPSTLLSFHKALVKRKYHLLFSSNRRGKPGPKGPTKELIQAIVDMKQRNPRFGCPRIAQQINIALGSTSIKMLYVVYLLITIIPNLVAEDLPG
jgi:hypothetical protein